MAIKYSHGNQPTRCGEPHCLRLGAPSCDYCVEPALKRLEAMKAAAEVDEESDLIRRRSPLRIDSDQRHAKKRPK